MPLSKQPLVSDQKLQFFIDKLNDRCSYHAIEFVLKLVMFGNYFPVWHQPKSQEAVDVYPNLLGKWLQKCEYFFGTVGGEAEEVELDFARLPAQWQHFLVALSFYISNESLPFGVESIHSMVDSEDSMVGQALRLLEEPLEIERGQFEEKDDEECITELQAFLQPLIDAQERQQVFVAEKNASLQRLTFLQARLSEYAGEQSKKKLTTTAALAKELNDLLSQWRVINSPDDWRSIVQKVKQWIATAERQCRAKIIDIDAASQTVVPQGLAGGSALAYTCLDRYQVVSHKEKILQLAAQEAKVVDPRRKGVRRKKRVPLLGADVGAASAGGSDDEQLGQLEMPTGMMAPLEFKLSASTRSLMAAARNSVVLQRVDVPELEEEVGSVAFEQRGGDDVPAFLDMPLVASGSEDESADEDESTDAGEAEEAKLALSSSGVTLGATPLKEINPDLLKDLACRRGPKTPGKVLSLTS